MNSIKTLKTVKIAKNVEHPHAICHAEIIISLFIIHFIFHSLYFIIFTVFLLIFCVCYHSLSNVFETCTSSIEHVVHTVSDTPLKT